MLDRTGRPLVIATAVMALITSLLLVSYVNSADSWGDDDAGYVLQAKALSHSAAAAEVRLNGELMRASDLRVGPDAYPWGYPMVLAAGGQLTHWRIQPMCYVTAAFLLVLVYACIRLGLDCGLGIPATVAMTALVAWQSELLNTALAIASDVPFLALSTLSLALTIPLLQPKANGVSPRTARTAWAALAAVLGFTMRSNGLMTIAAVVAALLFCPMLYKQERQLRQLAVYAMISAAGIATYFLALPDGSLVHASYLTLDPGLLGHQFLLLLQALGVFVPVSILPRGLQPAGGVALLVFAFYGALVLRERGLLLALYVLAHLALVTMFTGIGGARYWYPMLPPLAILCVVALSDLWQRLPAPRPGMAWTAVVLVLGMATLAFTDRDAFPPRSSPGPRTAETVAMFRFVASHTTVQQRIAFFKPRSMRLNAGRQSILAIKPETAATAAMVVLHGAAPPGTQLTAAAAAALPGYSEVYRSAAYRVYARTTHR